VASQNPQFISQPPGTSVPLPLPPPVQPSFPAFVSTDISSAGKLLPSLFPSVETSMLLEIAWHKFQPIDLCKLNSRFRSKVDVECLDSTTPHTGALREYPSLHSILIPLSMHFAILQAFAASAGDVHATFLIGHSAACYTAHLLELHQNFEWTAVVQYHMQFHLYCHQEMIDGTYSGWSQPDQLLMSQYLFGCARTVGASLSHSGSGKSKCDVSGETCFAFNKGSCTMLPCPDGCAHKCCKCGGVDHGERTCKKT
jgi:hypothetical protein